MVRERRPHSSHWGAFEAEVEDGTLLAVRPYPHDPAPAALLQNLPAAVRPRTRVAQPMVRAGWLDHGPGLSSGRGAEPFVPVTWPTAIALLAAELRRVQTTHGPQAIYAGSYGWA